MIWLPVVGKWADIDGYASIIAYADLLNQRGKAARTYIPIAPNYSVPDVLRVRELENTEFDLRPGDQAIILDISRPDIIHQFVPNEQILELIDHHPGYEEYWQKELGERAIIEEIGAVATSIFEWWGECWDYAKMSPAIAKLLMGAILDNTLNFTADITTERDRKAYEKLADIAQVDQDEFAAWYFGAVSKYALENLADSLLNDTKVITIPGTQTEFIFGQLTLWDGAVITSDKLAQIRKILDQNYQIWFLNVLDISAGRNIILTNDDELGRYFTELLSLKLGDGVYFTDQLYLRKEILSKMLEAAQ